MSENFYTVREVADRLKVSRETVRRRIRDGELHAVKLSSGPKAQLRIPASSFNEFLSR